MTCSLNSKDEPERSSFLFSFLLLLRSLKKYEDAENYYSQDFFVQMALFSLGNNDSFCSNAMVPLILYFFEL